MSLIPHKFPIVLGIWNNFCMMAMIVVKKKNIFFYKFSSFNML